MLPQIRFQYIDKYYKTIRRRESYHNNNNGDNGHESCMYVRKCGGCV